MLTVPRRRGHWFSAEVPPRSDPSPKIEVNPSVKNSLQAAEPDNNPDVNEAAPGEAPQPLTLNHPALNPGRLKRSGSPFLHLVGSRSIRLGGCDTPAVVIEGAR
jgi:hypothetical protein